MCACDHCFTCFIPFNIHGLWSEVASSVCLISPAPEDSKPDVFFPTLSCSERIVLAKETQENLPRGSLEDTSFWRRWAVWGIFSFSYSPTCSLLQAWSLNCKMWEWDIWNHCCHFKSRRARRTHTSGQEALGVYSHTTRNAANLVWIFEAKQGPAWSVLRGSPRTTYLHRQVFPAWTGNTSMDWAQVSWVSSATWSTVILTGECTGLLASNFTNDLKQTGRWKSILERYPREQRAEPLTQNDREQKLLLFQFPESKFSGSALC